jgi:hypothetical protein
MQVDGALAQTHHLRYCCCLIVASVSMYIDTDMSSVVR